ncbi:MAG: DNA-binding response regulator [Acidobacteria bacterium]|nr:MAG: DNA-binding response regulator [Acidobacteriota bacterium]
MASPEPVRIVIADEQPIFRDGLRRLLETLPGLKIVGEASGDEHAAAMIQDVQPDILLLGLPASGPFQLDALEQTMAACPSVRTVILAGARSVDTFEVLTAAMQLGAHGIVPKDSPPRALFESIESVMAGRYWLGRDTASNDVAAGVRKLDTMRRQTLAFGLTRRELDILRAVVAGETNKAIARRLTISENTVKRHLTQIFDKVGVSSRIELAVFAAHHRLVNRK